MPGQRGYEAHGAALHNLRQSAWRRPHQLPFPRRSAPLQAAVCPAPLARAPAAGCRAATWSGTPSRQSRARWGRPTLRRARRHTPRAHTRGGQGRPRAPDRHMQPAAVPGHWARTARASRAPRPVHSSDVRLRTAASIHGRSCATSAITSACRAGHAAAGPVGGAARVLAALGSGSVLVATHMCHARSRWGQSCPFRTRYPGRLTHRAR